MIKVTLSNLERLQSEIARLRQTVEDKRDWQLVHAKEAELLAELPKLIGIARERDSLSRAVDEVTPTINQLRKEKQELLARADLAESVRDELRRGEDAAKRVTVEAVATVDILEQRVAYVELENQRLRLLVEEERDLNPHGTMLLALMRVLALKLAPYPFCSTPMECIKSGRCERNPVCNE